jgi:uncharacterized protein
MLYKFNDISDEGLSLNVPLSADWLKEECPDLEAKPAREGLTFRGHLSRQGDDAFLRGTLSGAFECSCARCLEAAKVPVRIPVQVSFVSSSDEDDDEAQDDIDVAHFDGDEINIGPELREQILLNMPINPVCREACAGLCPTCGVNRNEASCDCAAKQEPELGKLGAALRNLKM